jgi:hypothetical protein
MPKPKPGAIPPSGLPVMSGNYKIVYTLGSQSDSTTVTIKDDPIAGSRNTVKAAKFAMVERLRKTNDKLVESVDRLAEADDVLKKMETQLAGLTGKEADSVRKATKSTKDSVKALREMLTGKPKEKQGYYGGFAADITPVSQLSLAYRYVAFKNTAPGAQEEMMLNNAEKMTNEAVNKVNQFFSGQWKQYRTLAESTRLSLFKDYPPITTN